MTYVKATSLLSASCNRKKNQGWDHYGICCQERLLFAKTMFVYVLANKSTISRIGIWFLPITDVSNKVIQAIIKPSEGEDIKSCPTAVCFHYHGGTHINNVWITTNFKVDAKRFRFDGRVINFHFSYLPIRHSHADPQASSSSSWPYRIHSVKFKK